MSMDASRRDLLIHLMCQGGARCVDLRRVIEEIGYPHGVYATIDDLVVRYDPDAPGCVIADTACSGSRSMSEVLHELTIHDVHLPAIVVADRIDVASVVRAVQSGAIDVIERPVDADRLSAALERAREVDAAWRARRRRRAELEARLAQLTRREQEVMNLVVSGMGNKQIAMKLSRSEKTIEVHRAAVMRKMGVRSLAALVSLVHEMNDLLSSGGSSGPSGG